MGVSGRTQGDRNESNPARNIPRSDMLPTPTDTSREDGEISPAYRKDATKRI
jgi:hypothetical protein